MDYLAQAFSHQERYSLYFVYFMVIVDQLLLWILDE